MTLPIQKLLRLDKVLLFREIKVDCEACETCDELEYNKENKIENELQVAITEVTAKDTNMIAQSKDTIDLPNLEAMKLSFLTIFAIQQSIVNTSFLLLTLLPPRELRTSYEPWNLKFQYQQIFIIAKFEEENEADCSKSHLGLSHII